MAQVIAATEVLDCDAGVAWECCKALEGIVPGGAKKECVDEGARTLRYVVAEGDSSYANFTAEVRFVAAGENRTEATWTGRYDAVGEASAPEPEHVRRAGVAMLRACETAARARRTLTHTGTLDASPDAIWSAVRNENHILPRALPHIFESCTFIEGSGEVGSVRVCRMGPVIPNGGEVVERLDVFDEATKRVGYTVIRGDPRFKHVSAVMHFVPGPTEGTTTATWTATYVPVNEHASLDNRFCIAVWKALESAAKA